MDMNSSQKTVRSK